MKNWCWIRENILQVVIPYKDIDTTVYLLQSPQGLILFDTAAGDEDLQTYLFPVLEETGLSMQDLRYIFISHNHRDHARGVGIAMAAAPQAVVLSRCPNLKSQYGDRVRCPEDGLILLERFWVVTIPGHTADSAALLDTHTDTLITGDCLQLFGIYGSGLWGANITLPTEHLRAIEKVRALRLQSVLCAHDYHPYGRDIRGRELVDKALDACVEPLMRLRRLIMEHPELDDESVCTCYGQGEHLPTVGPKVAAALRSALREGAIT